jgi:DNA invertase Pin-like site-specific DNA recombinase
MKKYVAYYRVSTGRQGLSGLGLDSQKKSVRDFVASQGGELINEFTDIMSGTKDRKKRQGFNKAITECQLKGAVFLAAKFDRMARSQRILLDLQESDIEIQAVDMPEANKLTIGLFAVIAEYESQMISERTKAALKVAKARGVKLGNPDLSKFRNTDTTIANEVRIAKAISRNNLMSKVVSEIINDDKSLSLRQLAQKLNEQGYTTARGKDFQANTVRRLIA